MRYTPEEKTVRYRTLSKAYEDAEKDHARAMKQWEKVRKQMGNLSVDAIRAHNQMVEDWEIAENLYMTNEFWFNYLLDEGKDDHLRILCKRISRTADILSDELSRLNK